MSETVLSPSTRRILEFDAVLEQIAGYAQSPLGSDATRALEPHPEGAADRLAEVAEMRELCAARGYVACGRAGEIEDITERAAVEGVVLDGIELARTRRTSGVIQAMRRHLIADTERWPRLAELMAPVPSLQSLIDQLDMLIDDDGELRDDASPELQRIRRAFQSARRAARDRLERMSREPRIAEALQEAIVTERRGRLVLAVRAGQRDRVPGVVHDTSSSGQTLFIEPLAAVEEQNHLAELKGQERDEIRRLLAEATAHVRAATTGLAAGCAALARADSLQGISRWAEENDAVTPRRGDQGIRLRGARHPLLDAEVAVPLNLELDADVRALVITGPNTGGKTVTLKTLGLAVLLAQSGVPVIATEATLPVFSRVHADIGDEQSLAASLSTFSGHLQNISAFLADCPPGALVLMDELGTGTDPAEGAALGIALVEAFVAADALVVASTHHDALKAFAQRTEGVLNAAMEFDPDTLAPTYRLRMGRPGRSNALDIATRLGLHADIVKRARELLSVDAVELDSVLRDLETQERKLERAHGALQTRRSEMEVEVTAAREEAADRGAAYRAAQAAAREAVEDAVRDLRSRGEERLRELDRRQPAASERMRADRKAGFAAVTGELRRAALDKLAQAKLAKPAPADRSDTPAASSRGNEPTLPLRRGTTVRVEPFGTTGSVLHDWQPGRDQKVEVDVGGKRLVVERVNVVPDVPAARRHRPARHTHRPRKEISADLDLHGMRVEEALAAVDRHIDDAILAELPSVRFIHGFGMFRLRDAIREHLRGRPEVAGLAAADPFSGGEGVTVVTLED